MANAVLVDSCYYIDRQRAGLDPFAELAVAAEMWEPITCGMVMLEVLRGIRVERDLAAYRETLSVMTCVPTTGQIWETATEILRRLERRGITIPPQDAIIAACALAEDAPVLTFDGHFSRIPGLTVMERLSQ